MNEQQLIGAIRVDRTDTFLAKGIRWFMNIWGRKTGKGENPFGNHAEILVWDQGRLMSMGAVKEGVKVRSIKESLAHVEDYQLFIPEEPLTEAEKERLWVYVQSRKLQHTPYQKFNFVSWILKIITYKDDTKKGLWLGKDTNKRSYCYEEVARAYAYMMGQINRVFDKTPEQTDIYDFTENPALRKIEIDLKKMYP